MTDENPLFTNTTNNQEEDTGKDLFAELVGEGKKYKTAQDAAKAIIEKDRYIAQLQSENHQVRSSLAGEKKIEDFLNQMKSMQSSSGNPSNSVTNQGEQNANQTNMNNSNNTPNQKSGVSIEEVEKLLAERERIKTEEQNLALSLNKVRAAFGANHGTIMQEKAAQLGATPEFLLSLAKSQPAAFLKLVGADAPAANAGPGLTQTQVNTAGQKPASTEKTAKYFRELRKQIGDAKFYRPDIQKELHDQSQKLGAAFFD